MAKQVDTFSGSKSKVTIAKSGTIVLTAYPESGTTLPASPKANDVFVATGDIAKGTNNPSLKKHDVAKYGADSKWEKVTDSIVVKPASAVSEATERALETPNCKYVLGSVMDHVILHQTIIGLELKAVLEKYNIEPDMLISCVGGGSNFGGFIAPFVKDKINGTKNYRIIGVEPASCPSLTRGKYAYDFGDTGKMTPLLKMYTLGNGFMPSASHSGGLRYHGMNPIVSKLYHDKVMEATTVEQTKLFEAAVTFAKSEGILPAPESSHSIRVAIDEALKCKKTGEKKKIVFCLTGTGYFDLKAYTAFNNKTMQDYIPTEEDLQKGFATIPQV